MVEDEEQECISFYSIQMGMGTEAIVGNVSYMDAKGNILYQVLAAVSSLAVLQLPRRCQFTSFV